MPSEFKKQASYNIKYRVNIFHYFVLKCLRDYEINREIGLLTNHHIMLLKKKSLYLQ